MNIKAQLRLTGVALALGLASLGSAKAQISDNRSPYSRYGYGSLGDGTTAGSRSLGGLSVGLRDGMITNPGNPASYTSVDSLTFIFDLGVSARYAFLKEGANSDKRILGNLEYLTMIYPLGKRMAMSAGILPMHSTGYRFGSNAQIGAEGTASDVFVRSYSGQGSYNQLYLGLAGHTLENLHLGVNASFVFGHTTHQREVLYASTGAFNQVFSSNLHLRGLKLDFGAQYLLHLDSAKQRSLVVGATFSPAYSYKSELTTTQSQYATVNSANTIVDSETLTNTNGTYTAPMQLGLGLSLRRADHYMYGVDVRYGAWTKAKFSDLQAEFRDTWRIALGGEWTPNARARNPWKRAKYRAGLWTSNSYLAVPTPDKSQALATYREYGASLGFALPLVDRRSALNFSIDYKWLRPEHSTMVSEHYIGATIGVIFNESWFRKARVN